MGRTSIEWCDFTFNPWWGCVKVSPACAHCYAESVDKLWQAGKHWGPTSDRRVMSDAYWRTPLKWDREAAKAGERRRVFCASMADVFEDRRDLDPWRDRLWGLIEYTDSLDWLLLTKRPEHVRRLAPERWMLHGWPRNVWLGTTVEDQQRADERIPHLLDVPARLHFLSCEPLLESIDLSAPETLIRCLSCSRTSPSPPDFVCACGGGTVREYSYLDRLDWVIVGGESGGGARPMDPAWARSIRDQCQRAGVAFHFKQWGEHRELVRLGKKASGRELDGRTWDESPAAIAR